MVADRGGDAGVFALGQREVAAQHALEFGELAHGAGNEVGLAEAGGAFGESGEIGTPLPLAGGIGGGNSG